MPASLRRLLVVFTLLALLTGAAYPLAITAIVAVAFPRQASGSLIRRGDTIVGSTLVGQAFDNPAYFWGRPSATTPEPYNGLGSGGSNLGPSNPALTEAVKRRLAALRAAGDSSGSAAPVDLVTASASGLDPHVSPAAARYQAARVARLRGLEGAAVERLIAAHTEPRLLGLFGEPRVNVLELNLALDDLPQGAREAR